MAENRNPADYGKDYKTLENNKKQWRWNVLIYGVLLLLATFLPPPYEFLAPLLILIPILIGVVNKIKRADGSAGIPSTDHSYSPLAPDRPSSSETNVYKPEDPKDPRRYKPIG